MQAEPRRPLPLAAFAVASLLPVALLGLGLWQGGVWLWVAFLYMAVLTILLDQLIPLVPGQSEATEFPGADLLLATIGLGTLILLPAATWAIAGPSALSPTERILTFFATGFWLGQVGHPAAHELIHRSRRVRLRPCGRRCRRLVAGRAQQDHGPHRAGRRTRQPGAAGNRSDHRARAAGPLSPAPRTETGPRHAGAFFMPPGSAPASPRSRRQNPSRS